MDALAALNADRRREVEKLRDTVAAARPTSPPPAATGYPLARLRARIEPVLAGLLGQVPVWESDLLDRSRFGADLALRLPGLLREHGAKDYVASRVPAIAEALRAAELADVVDEVTTKGIYVNVRLTGAWFLTAVASVVELGDRFGLVDTRADRTEIVDYSSPNVAKVLHAGHLRSTVIGHVLSNLYEACGALVYRVNHINDFGGFGYMLEGFRRFDALFPVDLADNQRSLAIYTIRRTLERAAAGGDLDEVDGELLERYLPGVTTPEALRAAHADFVAAADRRFAALEQGDADEVALWQQVVAWSLADFQSFYTALGIEIDFVIGESFYLQAGVDVLEQAVARGRAYALTPALVEAETARLDAAAATGDLTPEAREQAVSLLAKDVGALVVPLPGGERLVARRSDGRSIYATRDLGAIALRRAIFDPTDINYVVGQEQRVHFARVFAAAEALGLVEPGEVRLKHTYFGFYVDAASGRKLSSRDSVAGVNELLAESFAHYRAKTAGSGGMTEAEVEEAAHQLALGSVLFNDLKSDMKGPVAIATGDLAPTIAAFEKSGGPYVVYSACRARAILRRYGRALPNPSEVRGFDLIDQESLLILRLVELPEKVARAAADDNPAVLVRHLLDIAGLYNSYYAVAPVLQGDRANEFRLLVTRAVQHALVNGLRLCHIECPPKI